MKLTTLLLLTASSICMAQRIENSLISTSSYSNNQNNRLSYTIGQPTIVLRSQSIQKKAEKTLNNTYKVWPNPVTDLLHLKTNQNTEKFFLFNTFLQVVASGKLPSNTTKTLDVTSYPSGVYFLSIQNKKADNTIYRILKK